MEIFLPFFTFFLSYILFKFYPLVAHQIGLIAGGHSLTKRDERIPTSGGIILSILFCSSVYFLSGSLSRDLVNAILIGSSIVSITGLIDDKYNLSSILRINIQICFVVFVGYCLDIYIFFQFIDPLKEFFFLIILLLVCVWILNTFNFIDGADGLLSTNVLMISLALSLYLILEGEVVLAISMFILASLNLSFLLFNWSPARIFMGDCGSLFLGSLFVVYPMYTIVNSIIPISTWLILLSMLYVETTVTLLVRTIDRKNIFNERHNYHAYQQLIVSYADHSMPARYSIVIFLFYLLPLSYISYTYQNFWASVCIVFFTITPLAFLFYFYGPKKAKENQKNA